MVVPTRHLKRRLPIRGMLAGVMLLVALAARAESSEGFHLESTGARGGLSANAGRDEFHEAESFLNLNLPWAWDLGKQWHLQSRLDFTAGWIGDSTVSAAMGNLGPSLVLRRRGFPLSFEGG